MDEKKKEKKVEQMAQKQTASNLVKYIIAETFARHSKLSEEEFLKEIGFDGKGVNEDKAIRIGCFNIMISMMNYMLEIENKFNTAIATMKLCMGAKGEKDEK
jgi:hypothetical protein